MDTGTPGRDTPTDPVRARRARTGAAPHRGRVRIVAGAAAGLAMLLAGGCATQAPDGTPNPPPGPPVLADMRDYRIDLKPRQVLEIRLPSNPSTGYRWVLIDPVPPTVRQVDLRRERSQRTEIAGAPGTEVWQFEGDTKGVGVLQFEYRRTFEPPTLPPAQRAAFRVHVR
jgi:inhibitor of cysteine peptidase